MVAKVSRHVPFRKVWEQRMVSEASTTVESREEVWVRCGTTGDVHRTRK